MRHGGYMDIKLFDSELKVMEVLWKDGDMTAGQLAKLLKEEIGWNRNTTYTVIKKCIEKGAIEREEPNFMCKAAISRIKVQKYETKELIEKMYDGSKMNFFAAFLNEKSLSEDEIEILKQMVDELK
jgi:predicted transcriptional regulator